MKKINLSYIGIIGLILLASFSRIIPHISNFTPIGAIALFGGAYFKNKIHSFIIPILSLWISDLLINNYILSNYEQFTWFYPGFLWQYSSFCIIIFIGNFALKKPSIDKIFLSSISSSLLFFIITNFGVWIGGSYSNDLAGLATCYILALPFFGYTLVSTIIFSTIIETVYKFSKFIKT